MATRISWNDIGADTAGSASSGDAGATAAAAPGLSFPGTADAGLRKRPAGIGTAGSAARILESRDLSDMHASPMLPPPPVPRARPAPHSVLSLSRIESALFRVAYAIAKEDDVPPRMWWVLRFFDDWQLLAFAFAPRLLADMPTEVSYIVEPLRYVAAPYSNFVQINAFALAILFLTLALLAFVATRLLWGPGSVPPWPLKVLRVLLAIVQTALALPMLLVFLAGVRCVNNVAPEWNLSCTASPHAPLVVLDAIALALYLPLLAFGAAFVLLALAILAYLISTLLQSLPYYTPGMTVLRTALTTAAAAALAGTMAATAIPTLANAWLVVVLPCAGAGFLGGILVSRRAHTAVFDGAVRRWHAAAIADASSHGGGHAGGLRTSASTAHADRVRGVAGSAVRATAGAAGGDAPLAADAAAAHSMLAQLMQGTSVEVLAVVRQRKSGGGRTKVFRAPAHVEACLRVLLRGHPTPDQATLALHLLARGLREFDSPALLLDAARALGAWFDPAGASAASAILDDVRKRKLAVDLKFHVYAHDRAAAEQAGTGGDGHGEVDALESAELRGVSRAATTAHLRSLHAARAVFESVRTGAAAPVVSAAIGTLALHRATALRAYARLLAACPKSKTVLRAYAQFLMTVDGNAGKAAAVLDMVEEAEVGDHVGSSVLRETPAIVEEGDRGGDVGTGENGSSAMGMGVFRESFRPGNTAMSDQSGSSASKAHRQKQQTRKQLVDRIVAPLQQRRAAAILGLLYLASLVAGFALSVLFVQGAVNVVNTTFVRAALARRTATSLLDGVHRAMTSAQFPARNITAHLAQMRDEHVAAMAQIRGAVTAMETDALPYVVADAARAPPAMARAFFTVNSTFPTLLTTVPATMAPANLFTMLLELGHLILEYPAFGEFSPEIAEQSLSARFVVQNYATILAAVRAIPDRGIAAFQDLVSVSQAGIVVMLVAAVVLVGVTAAFVYFKPLHAYFQVEDRVLRALRSLSKPAAAAAVTALDEEIEAFAELTEADSDEHDENGPTVSTAGIDAAAGAGAGTPADATGAGGAAGPGDGAGPRVSPRTRMARKVVAAAVGVAVVTAVMFAFPLMCNGVDRDLQLIVQSNARQQQVQVTTLLVREMLAPEPLFADPANEIRAVRSALYDLTRVHAALVVSSTRLAALLPALTVQPQPCPATTPIPARCITTVIGDAYVASPVAYAPEIPLNQAVRTFIDAAGQLVTNSIPGAQLARPGLDPVVVNGVSVTPTLPNDGLLVLVQKIAQDIDIRVAALDQALRDVVTAQLMQAMGGLVVAFVVAVVAAVVVAVAAATAGFRGLRDRAHTLAAVLHLVPPGVSKDAAGEVARLVESGGLALVAVGQEHE
ncbi:hypothetical protein GGF31_001538 [Allomyces arbusculus]|nr:hypothetical protein GGF31_001538 [Allomyces arbusculus]